MSGVTHRSTDRRSPTLCLAVCVPWLLMLLVGIVLQGGVLVWKATPPGNRRPITGACEWVYTGDGIEASWEFSHDYKHRRLTERQAAEEFGQKAAIRNPDEVPRRRFPRCILLGFSKCGTSALLEFLQKHPDVETVSWEINYFCDERYLRYGLEWYRSMMPPTLGHQTVIEKSPCYVTQDPALPRLRALNSRIKVMVIVREPLSRLQSSHSHEVNIARIHGLPRVNFEDMYFINGSINNASVLKWGTYAERIHQVYQFFPRDQVLLLDGDTFISNPVGVLKQVENFLGIRRYFTNRHFYFDQRKRFFCYRQDYNRSAYCLGKNKGRKHEDIPPELKIKLLDFLQPFTLKFYEVARHNFNWSIYK